MLSGLKDEEIRQFFDRTLTPQLLSLNVSRIAGNVLAMLTEGERHQGCCSIGALQGLGALASSRSKV